MNDCITTKKQSTTKPCAYFLGYTVNPTDSIMASSHPQFYVVTAFVHYHARFWCTWYVFNKIDFHKHWNCTINDCLISGKIRIEYCMYSSGELFMRSQGGYFGVYFPSCAATTEINIKITLEWVHEQFVTRVHTLSYFVTQHNESINDDKNGDVHTSSPCLTRPVCVLRMTSQSTADNVTLTRQLWGEHVKMISNALHIDLIHGDIHDWPCNKN